MRDGRETDELPNHQYEDSTTNSDLVTRVHKAEESVPESGQETVGESNAEGYDGALNVSLSSFPYAYRSRREEHRQGACVEQAV